RLDNYRAFRDRLGVPLVAVELAFDGAFSLKPGDADILVQLNRGDVMWQKERLLNIGIARLPAACSAVAVFDADIILADPDWADQTLRALSRAPAVQLFSQLYLLAHGVVPRTDAPMRHLGRRTAVAAALHQGMTPDTVFGDPRAADPALLHRPLLSWGAAWAYPKALLDRHGLYDAHILFGGDTAIAAACAGDAAMTALEDRHAMTAAHRRHYRAWAAGWAADAGGRMAALPGMAFHLWHGSTTDRYTRDHHRGLAALGFDPAADLRAAPGEAWRWSGAKPALEKYLADYFDARQDDASSEQPA
ncbi:MAG: hypothetical protein SFV21_10585, partial [Rhodospirillaceae bacterium]|nr:hypothetical protein [Rhodospirillaceae bacterium]